MSGVHLARKAKWDAVDTDPRRYAAWAAEPKSRPGPDGQLRQPVHRLFESRAGGYAHDTSPRAQSGTQPAREMAASIASETKSFAEYLCVLRVNDIS